MSFPSIRLGLNKIRLHLVRITLGARAIIQKWAKYNTHHTIDTLDVRGRWEGGSIIIVLVSLHAQYIHITTNQKMKKTNSVTPDMNPLQEHHLFTSTLFLLFP